MDDVSDTAGLGDPFGCDPGAMGVDFDPDNAGSFGPRSPNRRTGSTRNAASPTEGSITKSSFVRTAHSVMKRVRGFGVKNAPLAFRTSAASEAGGQGRYSPSYCWANG